MRPISALVVEKGRGMPTYRVAVYRRIDDLACATVEIEHPSESPDADHEEIVAAAVAEANRRDEKDELDWDIGEGGVWDDIDPDLSEPDDVEAVADPTDKEG
jgi:hypothetical protein